MELVIVADDRTGAIETAGAIADEIGSTVPVATGLDRLLGTSVTRRRVGVVDLGSRRVTQSAAAALSTDAERRLGDVHRHGHKIDSTLRGNWAIELVARHRVAGRRVLVVAALPALGRTCVDGVVRVDGRPVHEGPSAADVGRRTNGSRPVDLLTRAGAERVDELAGVDQLDEWLARGAAFGVCDASSDDDVSAITGRWAASTAAGDVLLAGTSAVLASAAAKVTAHAKDPATPRPPGRTILQAPVVVVCGSLHDVARAQIDALRAADPHGRVELVVTDRPLGSVDGVAAPTAQLVAARLARSAHDAIRRTGARTVVVIGGDTAAAVLGDATVEAGGTVAPGTPWCRHDDGPAIVVRSGGFGAPDALVELLAGTLSP